MLRGTSTPPASRHRAPLRQGLRTGQTCMSCRSPRSPCPWPSSRGAQVSEPPREARAVSTRSDLGSGLASGLSSQCSRGEGGQGLGGAPFWWEQGHCGQAWVSLLPATSPT